MDDQRHQTAAEILREARRRADLTQRDLARRAGVSQSVISVYESGRRQPSLPMLQSLVAATGQRLEMAVRTDGGLVEVDSPRAPDAASTRQAAPPTRGPRYRRIARDRQRILDAASRHGATNLRLFGSVARGEEADDSDIDILVDLPSGAGLLTLLRLKHDLQEILHDAVDVIPADSLRPDVRERVDADAVPL
jgi:uncharacterized protein